MTSKSSKLIFFVTADWFFCSHFIDRAISAREAGYDVAVITQISEKHQSIIESAGIRVIPLSIDRKSLNPFSALVTLWRVMQILQKEKPDILHQVALKPILIGGLAAKMARVNHIVNAVVGGGYALTSSSMLMRLLRPIIRLGLKLLLNPQGSRVIFENSDDLSTFVQEGWLRAEDAVLIRGAGVNESLFQSPPKNNTLPLIAMPSRLLWDKGVGEFVQAARMLRDSNVKARFVLVGHPDPGNRASIDPVVLEKWKEEGIVEFWGFRQDMPRVLNETDIVCLPSYREGLPKVLLEAMAASLPCVTTDVPGCREAVQDQENGLLVPPRDAEALAQALHKLIQNQEMRVQMGRNGRFKVLNDFSSSIICKKNLEVYEKLMSPS